MFKEHRPTRDHTQYGQQQRRETLRKYEERMDNTGKGEAHKDKSNTKEKTNQEQKKKNTARTEKRTRVRDRRSDPGEVH